MTLVELAGDDGVLDQKLERNDLEGVFVGCFEDDGARSAGLLDLEPARCTEAPAVAGFQARKAVLRHGRAQVVAEGLRRRKERCIDDAADGVDTVVVGAGVFITIPLIIASMGGPQCMLGWLLGAILAALRDGPSPIKRAVEAALQHAGASVPIELEVDNLDQLNEALACKPAIVLLDNMMPQDLREAVRRRDAVAPNVLLVRRSRA